MSKRRSRSQWQQLISSYQTSGLSRKDFCQREGIALSTFDYWKRKLRAQTALPDPVAQSVSLSDWIELSKPVTEQATTWQIELDLGNGLCLRLTQG